MNGKLSESQRFIDSTTLVEFERPVVAPDGWTYEFEDLVAWLKKGAKFLPKTRHPISREVVLYPNFGLAEDMVQEGAMDKIPFKPGEVWKFRLDHAGEKAIEESQSTKLTYKVMSLLNCLTNIFCSYLAFREIENEQIENPIIGCSLILSFCSIAMSGYSAFRIHNVENEYNFRNIITYNLALSFFTSITNVALFSYLSAAEVSLQVEHLAFLMCIPKSIYDACTLFSEAKRFDFYTPAKQNDTNKVIEIV
jgi:hypothetical protein